MSQYLVERIRGLTNVEVLLRTEICGVEGANHFLEKLRWRNRDSGQEETKSIAHLFSFIGADPNTDWLDGSGINLDEKGFVITGAEGAHLLGTNRPGVFAVGDVRCGVGQAGWRLRVGEGSTVVSAIHGWLAGAHERTG